MESFRNLIEGLLDQEKVPVLFPSHNFSQSAPTEDDITLTLTNLPLIDTSKATWNQILEFREDEKAKSKLRDLKLFLHINYMGKSPAFIEDDLNKRLENYKAVCKDWGFETRNAIFSSVMDSQCLLATTAATLGTIFLHEPIGQTISALAGATLNIGKILLTYDKQKHAFHKLKRDHDLAYIIKAKERFTN